jgi:hypothetical protein
LCVCLCVCVCVVCGSCLTFCLISLSSGL